MAFKQIADLDTDVTTALGGVNRQTGKKNPTSIEGYYIGTKQVPSKKSSSGFAALHIFQTEKGNVGVWGKTNLDAKMRSVTPGVAVRVTFLGMQETRNNPMYKYSVEVDTENTIEVASASTASESGDDSESEDGEDYGASSFGDESEDSDDSSLPAARQAGTAKSRDLLRGIGGRRNLGE